MTRKRTISTEYNIKYVHVANGRIVYRPYIKVSDRNCGIEVDSRGFLKPPISLGKAGEDPDIIFSKYLSAKDLLIREKKSKEQTLGWIVENYEDSRQYKKLAISSQKRNKNLKKILNHPIRVDGKENTLKNLHIDMVKKPYFQTLAEKRLENYQANGKDGHVQVNREITFISSAISWATNYLENFKVSENPLKGLIKLPENSNTRYVTDVEYDIQYKEAVHINDYLQPVFELTYLLATRGIETLDIRLSDCTDLGIIIHRRKGSLDTFIEWSDRLKSAYMAALDRQKNIKHLPLDPYLIAGFSGGKLAKSTLDDAVQKLKKHLTKKGLGHIYWNLHLLKSKGISDSDNKKIAGHKTEAMRQKYDTKIHTYKPVR